jgi:cobalt-zinc-cadmium efflux system membrane fusion protein
VLSGLKVGDQYAGKNSFAVKAEIGKLGATHDH